jgi:hypothetical protein
MWTRRFAFVVSIFLPTLSPVANAQFLSQDEARHQAYCRWHSEADRIEIIRQDQQKTDPQSRGDVAYIMANCPPSQQAIDQHDAAARQQQAADYSKYLSVTVMYQANGEAEINSEGQVFRSTQDCDRFIGMRMNAAQQQGSFTLLGNTVLEANDGSGYIWYGCIHLSDRNSEAYLRYIDIPMTEQRGRMLKRFPTLG